MAEIDIDAEELEQKVHDLAASMERVRQNQAARDDVVVEMKHAKIVMLELLAEDLQSVFEEIPREHDQFEFSLTRGETPRLWIDMTSHVRVGADRQVYEFVKDTSRGRIVLGRERDREEIGKQITDYVAERILERERAIEGDRLAENGNSSYSTAAESANAPQNRGRFWTAFLAFVFGTVAGMALLLVLAWSGGLRSAVAWLFG